MHTTQLPSSPTCLHQTWSAESLLPDAWRDEASTVPWFIFNPTLAWLGSRYIMLYRVVQGRNLRIAACHLDEQLQIIHGSVTPFSDSLHSTRDVIGDPRLFFFAGRLFASYTHYPLPSTIYIVELDPWERWPTAAERPLLLDVRQLKERNWTIFQYHSTLYALYSIVPHAVLELDLSDPLEVRCQRVHCVTWDANHVTNSHGSLRGGAAPVQLGETYNVFFHGTRIGVPGIGWLRKAISLLRSSLHANRVTAAFFTDLHARLAARTYIGGFYRFAAQPPFAPIDYLAKPVLTHRQEAAPGSGTGRLMPKHWQVIFPGGAVFTSDQRWVVSYGLHNESCCARVLEHTLLIQACTPARIANTG